MMRMEGGFGSYVGHTSFTESLPYTYKINRHLSKHWSIILIVIRVASMALVPQIHVLSFATTIP